MRGEKLIGTKKRQPQFFLVQFDSSLAKTSMCQSSGISAVRIMSGQLKLYRGQPAQTSTGQELIVRDCKFTVDTILHSVSLLYALILTASQTDIFVLLKQEGQDNWHKQCYTHHKCISQIRLTKEKKSQSILVKLECKAGYLIKRQRCLKNMISTFFHPLN